MNIWSFTDKKFPVYFSLKANRRTNNYWHSNGRYQEVSSYSGFMYLKYFGNSKSTPQNNNYLFKYIYRFQIKISLGILFIFYATLIILTSIPA